MSYLNYLLLGGAVTCLGLMSSCTGKAKASETVPVNNDLTALEIVYSSDQDVTQFRGPNRDGIYSAESGLLKEWPEGGPQLIWENSDLVQGYSSPAVLEGMVYITGMNEDKNQEVFFAIDKTGKTVYQTVYGKPWKDSYPETRTTPTIVDGKAYVISGMGEVVCIDIADGSIVWNVDGTATYGSTTGNWGTAECPLVFDNKVIYSPGGSQTTVVALDKESGKEIWKSRSLGEARNYAQPALITWNGKRQIVGATRNLYYGIDPENGEVQWTAGGWYPPSSWENIAPNGPLFKDGILLFAQGYGINATAFRLADDMKSVTVAWKNNDLSTHHGGYVLVNGVVYGSNWINNSNGNWVAIDWNTGNTLYNNAWSGGKGKGSTVYADGMLYTYDERRGFVGLVRPTTDKFDVVSEFRITKGSGPNWAHIVISNGIMYVRHGEYLAAYKVK